MQYIDKDGNIKEIPLAAVQPIVSPDTDNILYEADNGLKVRVPDNLVVKTVEDKNVTNLTNPDNITGQCWYRVKNNMVTVGVNGLRATGSGYFYFTGFPAKYFPVGQQVCSTVMSLNNSPGAVALLYVDSQAVKIRITTPNADFYGSVSYMI